MLLCFHADEAGLVTSCALLCLQGSVRSVQADMSAPRAISMPPVSGAGEVLPASPSASSDEDEV